LKFQLPQKSFLACNTAYIPHSLDDFRQVLPYSTTLAILFFERLFVKEQ